MLALVKVKLTNVMVDKHHLHDVVIEKISEKRANRSDLIAAWKLFNPTRTGDVTFSRFLGGLRLLGVETKSENARALFESICDKKESFGFQDFIDKLLKRPKGSEVDTSAVEMCHGRL